MANLSQRQPPSRLIEYFSMAAPYALKWDQTFGNGLRNLFSKPLIKCIRVFSTSKPASIGDFPSKISGGRAIAKRPQLYPSVCFWTGNEFLYTILV